MRRVEREVNDVEELFDIVERCKICRIAVKDNKGLYIIPMNFGFERVDNTMIIYLHCAKDGRKVNAFAADSNVALEMDCDNSLIEADKACLYGWAYKSICGTGDIFRIDDRQEQKKALALIMKHQTGKDFEITDSMAKSVLTYKIDVKEFTGKRRNV